jgi:putative ABC transport system permease protein
MVPIIRRIVQSARAGLPAADVHLMQDQLDPQLAPWRLGAMAFTALGGVAATVAILGLFSIMSRLVAERRPDFAIRRALGARTGQIVAPVLGRGLAVVATGAAAGLVVTWSSSHWLQPLLFHVGLLDASVVAPVLASLLIVALAAALMPARRAATADPMDALRAD